MASSPNPYILVPVSTVSNGDGHQHSPTSSAGGLASNQNNSGPSHSNSNGAGGGFSASPTRPGFPASPTRQSMTQTSTPSIAQTVSQAHSLAASSANLVPLSSNPHGRNGNPNTFRAPAHKHAHHLHSIPPREKSTRTLIIDHMLWVHGRTRFAQARAELGMTDRTGGPGTPQYLHRHRPENYEEEDDVGSDGEDAVTLKARAGDPGRPHNDDEDERLRSQDLVLARALRLRAEGLEKVITSMLDQPPPPHRPIDEELLTPPTSPRIHPSGAKTTGPHTLPNGVRLRLALGTMINDLFARQAPVPPHRDRERERERRGSMSPVASTTGTGAPAPPLPPALTTIATVSAACPDKPSVQPWTRPSSSMRPGPGPMYPVQPRSPPTPSARTRALYNAGADPSTANSPPAFRCPRHLHTGCEICVEATTSSMRGASARRGSEYGYSGGAGGGGGAGGAGRGQQYWKAMPGGVSPEGGGITGWLDGSGIGSGLSRPKAAGTVLRRKMKGGADSAVGGGGGGGGGGEGIGEGGEGGVGVGKANGTGNTKLSELIPRFLRLSAMVAAEMGREARGEEEEPASPVEDPDKEDESESPSTERGWDGDGRALPPDMVLPPPATPVPVPQTSTSTSTSTTGGSGTGPSPYENQTPMYESALRPSREWYLLLAGLLTRAVLEGYLTAGWRGPDAVDCLLKVGLGLGLGTPPAQGQGQEPKSDGDKNGDEFAEFDPDELPSLLDAARMLFPAALRDGNAANKGLAEEEFEMEMETRLRRFYDIPQSTPDLSTHMEDLAWQYPAEPVERAAVRFCEAIEKWRGKPELETYKKKPPAFSSPLTGGTPSTVSSMAIDTLVHGSPATGGAPAGSVLVARSTRKPSIDVYFPQPFPRRLHGQGAWSRNVNKRMRSPGADGERAGPAKAARTNGAGGE